MRGFLVEVPFRTSQMLHLKASALFLKVQTLQSQKPSSAAGFACLFGLGWEGSADRAGGTGKRERERERAKTQGAGEQWQSIAGRSGAAKTSPG